MSDVFISYSRKNIEFARNLFDALESAGVEPECLGQIGIHFSSVIIRDKSHGVGVVREIFAKRSEAEMKVTGRGVSR